LAAVASGEGAPPSGKHGYNMPDTTKFGLSKLQALFMELFGLSRQVALAASLLIVVVAGAGIYWFVHSAPPRTITISAGPAGSSLEMMADRFRTNLERSGVTLKILTSQGSQENLERLEDPSAHVDIAFVQGGVTNSLSRSAVVSLGSINYQPLLIFYRSDVPITLLSQLAGKRVAIGPQGSGTRALALALLDLNGIGTNGPATLLNIEGEEASRALLEGSVDAVFLMGDSASPQVIKKLLQTPEVQLYDFVQADGYSRKISYLNRLDLPRGSIDFGKDIPSHDVGLVAPTVELLARPELHPALSDLLLEAAQDVSGGPSLLRRRGEFPSPVQHDVPISADAQRFYKSGKSFLYKKLPFWLASLLNRVVVVFVPMLIILIPGLKLIPNMYRWRMRLMIYKWYRALLSLEREVMDGVNEGRRKTLSGRLDEIETAVNRMRVPASFADQFYVLRQNIMWVRKMLLETVAK
jgi:hypothetical protein